MKLYIMRHGPAEDFSSSGHDADRALTTSGRTRVREVAQLLRTQDEQPKTIVSSPLVRALQTAEIVAAELSIVSVETHRGLAPGGDADGLIATLLRDARKRVMLVGHEPDLSDLVARLAATSFDGMLKAMVVGLDLEPGDGEIRFVLDPKALVVRRPQTNG